MADLYKFLHTPNLEDPDGVPGYYVYRVVRSWQFRTKEFEKSCRKTGETTWVN